jgi:hemolysin activation/secretion protein
MIRIPNPWFWLALAAASAANPANPAHAQTRPAASGNPLEALPQIRTPNGAPNVSVKIEPNAQQLEKLLGTHLTPSKVQIDGVKAIAFPDVAKHFSPFVGKDTTIGQLVEAANAVTRLYQSRGYALSFAFVPAQAFENGVVHVTVVEGYVSSVKITGNPGGTERKIRSIADHILIFTPSTMPSASCTWGANGARAACATLAARPRHNSDAAALMVAAR